MEVGSLVRQELFQNTDGASVFRYGVLYKVPDFEPCSVIVDGVTGQTSPWGWVFWQLNRDGPYAVSSESYCEPVEFSSLELVAAPKTAGGECD